MDIMQILIAVVTGVVLFVLAWIVNWRLGQGKLQSARNIASRVIDEAKKEAETRKKEVVLEAKEECLYLQI